MYQTLKIGDLPQSTLVVSPTSPAHPISKHVPLPPDILPNNSPVTVPIPNTSHEIDPSSSPSGDCSPPPPPPPPPPPNCRWSPYSFFGESHSPPQASRNLPGGMHTLRESLPNFMPQQSQSNHHGHGSSVLNFPLKLVCLNVRGLSTNSHYVKKILIFSNL